MSRGSGLFMEHYTNSPWIEEVNAGIAGIVSLLANVLLIFVTSRVKSYSDSVRISQYQVCVFRLVFSMFVVVSSPTIMYISEVKALYIVKGGPYIPREIGAYILNLFMVCIITSCTGPAIQYFQVAYLLSNPALKNMLSIRIFVSSIPVLVAIPTFILIHIGYTPNEYEMNFSEDLITEITGRQDSSFLLEAEEKIFNANTGATEYDIPARICTFFMMTVMLLSSITVIVCFSHIQKSMRKTTVSRQSQKSQRQLNLLLMMQFLFPFLTIHIPFYTAFILPYMDIEFKTLSSNLPFLFAWCPAINPILIILLVKNIRDTLLHRKALPNTTAMTITPSSNQNAFYHRYSPAKKK